MAGGCTESECSHSEKSQTVEKGKHVSLTYTLTLDDDSVYDTNVGGELFTYTHGSGGVVPGLEAALEGMVVGERKQVTVSPEKGYGMVNPAHVSEVPKNLIPPEARNVGVLLQGVPRHGQRLLGQVTVVKEDTVVVDFNHPLAGKTLYFDVTVVRVE